MNIDNKSNSGIRGFGWHWNDNRGWTCPKCGTVYSPSVQTCFKCSNPPTQPFIPVDPFKPVEYPWNIDVWDNPITF